MKEIIDLVRRFVVAIETIAVCMKNPPVVLKGAQDDPDNQREPLKEKKEEPEKAEEEVRYEEMPRKELIKLCKKAGYEVKKGTKTTTLIRWLNRAENLPDEEDLADDLETETGFDPLTEKEEETEEDDLEESEEDDLEEDDPLGAEEEDEEEEITKEILHKALTKAIEKGGNSIVAKLLKTKSKDVANFKQLPEDDYPAVFKATMKYLESK